MRIGVFAVLSAFVVAMIAAIAPASAWEIKAMNDQIEKTNVIVSEICSGTIIDKKNRLVLTAYHCITENLKEVEKKEVDPKTGEIRTRTVQERVPMFVETWKRQDFSVVSSQKYNAEIVGYDRSADVAILRVIDKDWKPLAAAPFAPDSYEYLRGLPVYAVGNPNIEFDNSVTTGIISAPARRESFGEVLTDVPLFQHSASTIGGNSGGAVYNDNGELIGTCTGGIRGSAVSLAVPISFTKALLKRVGYGDILKR